MQESKQDLIIKESLVKVSETWMMTGKAKQQYMQTVETKILSRVSGYYLRDQNHNNSLRVNWTYYPLDEIENKSSSE